jgi:hypothetical protein
MKISYSKPGIRLAISPIHFYKVMKDLNTSQIKIHLRIDSGGLSREQPEQLITGFYTYIIFF